VPERKLANEYDLSEGTVHQTIVAELNALPENSWLTKEYVDITKYSGILILDGKYIKVRGYERKIPMLWGIDYLTHDIPVKLLVPSENEEAFDRYFGLLEATGYVPKIVVVDDRAGIATALLRHFPHARIQLCHVHFLENLRQALRTRTEGTHLQFFLKVQELMKTKEWHLLKRKVAELLLQYGEVNLWYKQIVLGIWGRRRELFAYLSVPECPNNTNLIELYNSHLNGRLKTVKGFKSFHSADRWLNAYVVRRRTKELTDCEGKFKHLNGRCSLEIAGKDMEAVQKLKEKLGGKETKNAPENER
jgi:transposase-like protein